MQYQRQPRGGGRRAVSVAAPSAPPRRQRRRAVSAAARDLSNADGMAEHFFPVHVPNFHKKAEIAGLTWWKISLAWSATHAAGGAMAGVHRGLRS